MDPTRCPGLEEAFKEQDTSQDDLTNDETLDRCCEAESWQPWNFHWPSALGKATPVSVVPIAGRTVSPRAAG